MKAHQRHIPSSAFKIRIARSCTRKIRLGHTLKINQVSIVRVVNVSRRPRNAASQVNHNCKIKPISCGKQGEVKMALCKKFETELGQITVNF
jgi:hypothetical protein